MVKKKNLKCLSQARFFQGEDYGLCEELVNEEGIAQCLINKALKYVSSWNPNTKYIGKVTRKTWNINVNNLQTLERIMIHE